MTQNRLKTYFLFLLVASSIVGSSILTVNVKVAEMSVFRVLALLLPAYVVIYLTTTKKWGSLLNHPARWGMLFFLFWTVYAALSYFWVRDRDAWFRALFFIAFGSSSAIGLTILADSKRDFPTVLNTFILMVVVVNVLAWYELITGDIYTFSAIEPGTKNAIVYTALNMPVVWFGNANNLALFLCIAYFVVFISIKTAKSTLMKCFGAFLMISILALCIQSRSRAIIIGLVLGNIVLLVHLVTDSIRFKTTVWSLLVFIIVGAVLLPVPHAIITKKSYNYAYHEVGKIVKSAFSINLRSLLVSIGKESANLAAIDEETDILPEFSEEMNVHDEISRNENIITSAEAVPDQATITSVEAVPDQATITSVEAVPDQATITSAEAIPDQSTITSAEAVPDQATITSAEAIPDQNIITSAEAVPDQNIITSAEAVTLSDNELKALYSSVGVRKTLLLNGLYFLHQSNYMGVGAGNIETYMAQEDLPYYVGEFRNIHNFWAEVLVAYGLPVFLALLIVFVALSVYLLIAAIKRPMRRDRTIAAGLLASLAAFSIASISPSSVIGSEWLWVFYGILMTGYSLLQRQKSIDIDSKHLDKRIIILSALNLWSMANGMGAPSFFNTVKAYTDAGWKTFLINPDNDNQLMQNINLAGIKHVKVDSLFPNASRVRKIGFFFKLISQMMLTESFINAANRIIDSYSFANTVIYAYEIAAVKAGERIAVDYHLPLVTRFQGTTMAAKPYNFINKLRYYPHFQAMRTRSDLVIMTDDGTKGLETLERIGNKSTQRLFLRNGVDFPDHVNAVDPVAFIPGFEQGEQIILTLSRLVKWKHVERAIDAFAKLPVLLRNQCYLVIIGDGDARQQLEACAKELEVKERVIFLGALSHDQAIATMNTAAVFLSLYDLSNVGNPLLEAMLCGKAIITLDVGDTSSVIRNNQTGILLPTDKANEASGYLHRLLTNNSERERLGENAKAFAEKNFYSWEKRMEIELQNVQMLLDTKENTYPEQLE